MAAPVAAKQHKLTPVFSSFLLALAAFSPFIAAGAEPSSKKNSAPKIEIAEDYKSKRDLSRSPERYVLFENEGDRWVPRPLYDYYIDKLKPGDTLVFPEGKEFVVEELLGNGQTTKVLAVRGHPGKAMRIPLLTMYFELHYNTAYGHKMLVDRGLSVVGLHEWERGQYLFVDRLPPNTRNFAQFVLSADIPPLERQKMRQAFLDFIREAASFRDIGDFGPGQIKYDPASERWILHDWDMQHREALYVGPDGKPAAYRSELLDNVRASMRDYRKKMPQHAAQFAWLDQLCDEAEAVANHEIARLRQAAVVVDGKIVYSRFNTKNSPGLPGCQDMYEQLAMDAALPPVVPAFLLKSRTPSPR